MGYSRQDHRIYGKPVKPVKNPHLMAALVSLSFLAVVLVSGEALAGRIENRYVHALALYDFPQKNQGSSLQSEAFRQPDLLPIYGSSELGWPDPFHANRIFRMYPTGFTTFPIGGNATEPLIILQKLAAVANEIRGKEVVISLSPGFFVEEMMPYDTYAGNFSRLHAYSLAFSTELSWGLKAAVARRMLDYPATLRNDRLLNFAVHKLSDGSPISRVLYYAIWPIGELDCWALSAQDHWETLVYIRDQGNLDLPVVKQPQTLKWPNLLAHAQESYGHRSDNNPFGYENSQWEQFGPQWLEKANSMDDKGYLRGLRSSLGWTDLDLLLRELKEMGADPMLLSMPLPGLYFDFLGVSRAARQQYYDRFEALAKAYGVSGIDFQNHDEDKYFFLNPGSHLSSVGWIYYAEALDRFYHGTRSSVPLGGN